MYDSPAHGPLPGPEPTPSPSIPSSSGISEELAQFSRSLADATDGLTREYVELVALASQMLEGVWAADSDAQFSQLQGRAFECGGAAAFWSRSLADLAFAFGEQDNPLPVRRWLSEIAESCLLLSMASDVQELRDSPLLNPMQLLDGIESEPVVSWLRRWVSAPAPAPEAEAISPVATATPNQPQASPYPYAETDQPQASPYPYAETDQPQAAPVSAPVASSPAGLHPAPASRPQPPQPPRPPHAPIDSEPDRRRSR